ncbi:hypothetical protein F4054_03630 [Candidatus Poribacteria bacterium]|nr:hypothetical protein [Candidatus Poribacteria bacterium]MYG05862.1 hypothetical protein [Candidatus Poribacteria bacterium]MYK21331.1 hypothetical protein [Candidatus Poribacteria bacterium]
MFIEIINPDERYKNSYRGMVNIEYVHQIKIIRGRQRQYELHINLSNSPSIELLGTKEECEQFYEELKSVLKTHKQLSTTDTLVFPPQSSSKPLADADEAEV